MREGTTSVTCKYGYHVTHALLSILFSFQRLFGGKNCLYKDLHLEGQEGNPRKFVNYFPTYFSESVCEGTSP